MGQWGAGGGGGGAGLAVGQGGERVCRDYTNLLFVHPLFSILKQPPW